MPYLITIFFPSICYGCTSIGKFHQYLNNTIYFSSIAWLSYLFICLYYCYIYYKKKKYIWVLLVLILIYIPGYPLLNFISIILCIFIKNKPFIRPYKNEFPGSIEIENHSDKIIQEYQTYVNNNNPECIRTTNPGFKIELTKNDNCWRAIYLKTNGTIKNEMIEHFPTTISLLKDSQIHSAFFSILDPGVEIPPHAGYYKGYLRYHLGVEIPTNDSAYIVCGDEKYKWKKGEGVLFDDMYIHYVKNPSQQKRVVLYLDIIRESNPFVNVINYCGIWLAEHSILLKLFLKNQHSQKKIY